MLFLTAIPAILVAYATSFPMLLLYGFLVGFAGNAFSVGTAWVAAWFPPQQQGYAMGLFGAGNVGASVTKFIGPALIALVPAAGFLGGAIPGGWRFLPLLYGVLLILMGLAVWFLAPRVDRKPSAGRPVSEMLAPLKELRVWRFSLYYVVTLGAYVSLAAWLPRYFVHSGILSQRCGYGYRPGEYAWRLRRLLLTPSVCLYRGFDRSAPDDLCSDIRAHRSLFDLDAPDRALDAQQGCSRAKRQVRSSPWKQLIAVRYNQHGHSQALPQILQGVCCESN